MDYIKTEHLLAISRITAVDLDAARNVAKLLVTGNDLIVDFHNLNETIARSLKTLIRSLWFGVADHISPQSSDRLWTGSVELTM